MTYQRDEHQKGKKQKARKMGVLVFVVLDGSHQDEIIDDCDN